MINEFRVKHGLKIDGNTEALGKIDSYKQGDFSAVPFVMDQAWEEYPVATPITGTLNVIFWIEELGLYIAGKGSGNSSLVFYTSPTGDESDWTEHSIDVTGGTSVSLNNAFWSDIGGGQLILSALTQVATTTPLVKSSDGINFSTVTFPSSVTLTEGVALTGRGRVIVADDWTDLIWYSDDLTTWTSAATAGGGIYIQNMAWSPKLQIVVMVGFASAGFRLQWSDDLGLTWGAGSGTTEQPNGVTWSKERELFYMGRDQVFKSSDGKVWTGTSRTGTGTGGNTPWCDDLGIALSFGSSGDTAIYSKDDFTTNTLIPGINATHTFTKKMVTYSSKRGEILAITSSPGGIFLRSKSITESKISETLTRTGTDLKPTNAGDTLTLDSSLYQPVFGDETGLILDIPFEEIGTAETQYDRSEKGYIFDSITGSPVVSATNGKYGSGVYLDGSASYEKAVVACPQGNEPISFELAFKGTTGLANGDALVSYGSAEGQKSIFLFYQGSSLYLQSYGSSLNLFVPIVLDTWYHVAATWDGTDGKLYLDGVLIGTDAAPPMTVTNNTIYIGDSAYHTQWTGNIDYAKVYNRVLTEDEIRTHYLRYGGNSVVKSDNFKVVDTNNNVNQIVDVNGTTLKDGSTATTQPTTDNSTKVASTAFVTAHETNGQWTRTGTDLAPTNVGDSVSTTGQLNIGDGTLDTEVALIQKDQDGQTLLRIKNANTGTDANTLVQVQSDGCGLNLRTYGTGSSSNPDAVAIDAFGNSGGLIIETDTKLTTRIGSTDRTEVTPEGLNVHDSVYQPVFADESTLIVDLPFKFYGTDETQYSSALDNIFTATGGVTSASTGGPQDGPNVHFDGTDDSLQCSNIDGLDFSTNEKLTVECWAKADEVTSARSIWTFHGTHGSYWEVFSLDISNANAVGLYFGDGIDGQAEGFVVSVDDVTTWHHYTATLDRVTNIMQLYVDDALANSITITGEDLAWTTPISLGLGGHVAKTTQWHGQVAEFKTYNKVLSSDEVRTHYIRQGGKSFIITDDFRIFGTDGTKHLEVDDNSLQYLDDNGSRFLIDISKVQLNTGNSAINVTDTDTTLYYAVEPRFVVDATKTMVASPDGTNTLEVDNSTATYNNNDIATQGDAVFELYSEADLPAPAAGISLLPSGKYIMKKAFSLAAIDEFQCFAGAVIEWTSEDKENHTLTHTEASKTLFNFGNSGGRLKIEHASFVLSGNNQTFINMTGKDFSSKINDFRVTFTGTDGTVGTVSNIFSGTTEFVDGALIGFKDGLAIDNTGGTQVLGVLFISDGTGTGALLSALNTNALAVNFNSNVFVGGASQSAYFIDPVTPVVSQIQDTVFSGVGSFFKAGTTGTFTGVTGINPTDIAIISVSDNGGVARFNQTDFVSYVGQTVIIRDFITNTAYNGTYVVTAVGTNYFEVSGIAFGSNETGNFYSYTIELTETGTTLSDGDTILLDTNLDTMYDGGYTVFNKQTNSFRVSAIYDTTATGTWDSGSLTENSKFVNSVGNASQADSSSNASLFVSGNAATTSTTGSGTWDAMNLGTASEGQSISKFKLINATTGEMEYTGLNPYDGGLSVSISAFKSAAVAVDHKFRAYKTNGSGAFDVIEPTRALTDSLASISLVTSIQLNPGDKFRVEIASQGAATTVTVQDISISTG